MKRNSKISVIQHVGIWFDDAIKYLKECRMYIWLLFGFFVFSGLIGFFIIPLSPEFSELISKSLSEIVDKTEGLNLFQLISYIFLNNSWVSLEGVFGPLIIIEVLLKDSGILLIFSSLVFVPLGYLLGVIPFLISFVNGIVVGFVLSKVYLNTGFLHFWKLLPHGIFELPAIFISLALGTRLGTFLFSKDPRREFIRRLIGSLKTFILVVLPLLITAAIIEGLLIVLLKQ